MSRFLTRYEVYSVEQVESIARNHFEDDYKDAERFLLGKPNDIKLKDYLN